FVQRDEAWWQHAFSEGSFEGQAGFDSSANAAASELDLSIRSPRARQPLGVIKAVVALNRLTALLGTQEVEGGTYLQLVDGRGDLLVTKDPSLLLQSLPDKDRVSLGPEPRSAQITTVRGEDELVVSVPAGQWWVLYREPLATAFAAARSTQRAVWLGALLVAAVAVGALFWLSQRLGRLVTDPVRAAGAIASRVAGGDLSVTVATHRAEAAEVADLMSSVHSMVVALRRLVGAIRAAADEAGATAQGGTGPEHVGSRQTRRRSRERRRGSGGIGAGIRQDPDVRGADEGGRHADEHAGPQCRDRSGARRSGGAWLCRRRRR